MFRLKWILKYKLSGNKLTFNNIVSYSTHFFFSLFHSNPLNIELLLNLIGCRKTHFSEQIVVNWKRSHHLLFHCRFPKMMPSIQNWCLFVLEVIEISIKMHEKLNHVDYQLAPVYRWTTINLEIQIFGKVEQIYFFGKKKEKKNKQIEQMLYISLPSLVGQ